MTYVPGDNWCICDLSGKKVLMSQTRKTWDGLRVHPDFWYPRNPQDFIKAISERSMAVLDGRSRPADEAYPWQPGLGSFCLQSPSGILWTYYIDDDGALLPLQMKWGTPQPKLELVPGYLFTVDDDGALHVNPAPVRKKDPPWRMYSPSNIGFDMTVDTDLAILITLVTGPAYMEGVFSLISPNRTSYVIYINNTGTVVTTVGSWGPTSTRFYLGYSYITVTDDGYLELYPGGGWFAGGWFVGPWFGANVSDEPDTRQPPTYRMVSTDNLEYMWHIDSNNMVQLERQGHWWDVSVTVHSKPNDLQDFIKGTYDATGQIAESGQESWMEE